GRWRFEMPEENGRSFLQGEYLEIEKDACLVFTWCHVVEHDDGSHDTTPVSKVIVRFEAEGAATRIMLRHEGIVREEGRAGVGKGWDECLINLNAYVELTA
ncbi:MAG: SRPBCC family protein, partial [Pseudomonadota bacterium]